MAFTCGEAKTTPTFNGDPLHHHHPLRSLEHHCGFPAHTLRGHQALQISTNFKACIPEEGGYWENSLGDVGPWPKRSSGKETDRRFSISVSSLWQSFALRNTRTGQPTEKWEMARALVRRALGPHPTPDTIWLDPTGLRPQRDHQ